MKLYIGNLSYQATESELYDWFAQAGVTVDEITIVRDRFSGESRGFAFADINDESAASQAIASCNGRDFLGRRLVVNEARPREERRPDRRPSGGGHGARPRRGPRY